MRFLSRYTYLATGYDEKVSSIRSAELPIDVSEIVARFALIRL